MKRLVWCAFFLFFSVVVLAQDGTALLNAVKTKLDKVRDYQAHGQMKVDVSFINAPTSAVTVYYKKPDQFKVKKSDGISLLPKGGVTVNLSSLLAGDDFTIVPAGSAVVKGVNTKVLKLLPLNDNDDIVLMTLYIDEKTQLIRKNSVTTRQSGSYEIELDYGKYAAWGLPDKVVFLFQTKDYKLPKGLTFEYEKGGTKKAEAPKDQKGRVEIAYSSYIINKGVDDQVFQSQ